jgi:hypothetical protein
MNLFVAMQKVQYLPIINSNATGQAHTGPHVVQSGNKRSYMINKFIRGKRKTIETTKKLKYHRYLILYPLVI